ncbi:MBL fold metallo-hydrolase [Halobacterium bonnevillei]|uniref:MBL fold metallo-hydrolase n=1 Tax=Halobacterium bonnevillei TaxID=2692200 RepID=A0A6B0SXT9_9EURY|nr:MBL fold metallo-hydrolase [Halobacterium bonnevillei]MXR22199.1 MBL fold metallo-hydrolase [Halobacterium bonnevillei]
MAENLAAGVQAFTSNAFLVDGDRTVLVDPGANFDVVGTLRERDADLDAVVVTHTHPDHVGNLEDVTDAFGVDAWGFDASEDGVDHELADGDTVTVGNHDYEVLHTPGHHPNHVCLYSRAASVLFSADLVFANGSFGRTDLAGGDRRTLVESIERVLDVVDSDLDVMHPGHGPSVTREAAQNLELAARAARFG